MKNNLSIRPMTLEDIQAIYDLEVKCFKVPWTKEAFKNEVEKNKLAHYYVLSVDNKVIGYGGVWHIMDEGHITNIAIDPSYRNKGYGKFLMKRIMEESRKIGIDYMTLEVRVTNTSAIKLYEALGFKTSGIRPNYYTDNQEDAKIMWVDLKEFL